VDPPVSAEMRWTCVGIAVTGALLVMAGVMLGFTAQVVGLPGGKPTLGVVAGGLILAGLFCGVLLIIASRPLAHSRRSAPAVRTHAGTIGQPGTSEEWIKALRPGPGDRPGDTKRP
jgi:hypothetical protein